MPKLLKYPRIILPALVAAICASTAGAQNTTPTKVAADVSIAPKGFEVDQGSAERINFSGQLGTLSERITAAACNLDAGVAVVESGAVLDISTFHFSRIHDALLYGNRGFGILGAEERARTVKAIQGLNTRWVPLQEAANATQQNGGDLIHVANLAAQTDAILTETDILVTEITGQYADPVALLRSDAFLIEIAGRQRMLSQRISKDVCLVSSGIEGEAAMENLKNSVHLFTISLDALQNGLDSVGIPPAPTQKIADGLAVVADEWSAIEPSVNALIGGAELETSTRESLFFAFLGLEARINNVVNMYDNNSKLNL